MSVKTFKNVAAQGDVYFRRANEVPADFVPVEPENGKLIVTHSETGHHHVMDPSYAKMYCNPKSKFDTVLVIDRPTPLTHERTYDTHEPILFDVGTYHVTRQREYTPEGFRRVED